MAWTRGVSPPRAFWGIHEAVQLRDGGNSFGGKGVLTAVGNVNDVIGPELAKPGLSCTEQTKG